MRIGQKMNHRDEMDGTWTIPQDVFARRTIWQWPSHAVGVVVDDRNFGVARIHNWGGARAFSLERSTPLAPLLARGPDATGHTSREAVANP